MKKNAALLALLLLSGCANIREAAPPAGALDGFQGQLLSVVTYRKPDFMPTTYGKVASGALLGLVGGLVAAAAAPDRDIIEKNAIKDPAEEISRRLSESLASNLKPSATRMITERDPASNDEAKISTATGKAGLILDVQTLVWGFIYLPLDLTHYKLMYTARSRLIDAARGKQLAQAPCTYDDPDTNPRPSYDEMLADNAAKLKDMLKKATDFCAIKMQATLLGGG
jgi:hypothetical protein